MTRHLLQGLRVCAAATMLVTGPAPGLAQTPLGITELLSSVDRALPLLERARSEVQVAEGLARESRGAFDLTFRAAAETNRGFYDNDRVSGMFQQPLAPLGLAAYGGYRAGRGSFAPYDGKAQTLSDGEISGGVELSLLRNRAVDSRRAAVQVADLGVDVAQRSMEKARLSYFSKALADYWDWVAAGQQVRVARALLELAEARDGQLQDSVALGQIAPVERTDNRRAILQRRSALAAAERQLQMKAIDLSLYLRAPDGSPMRPPVSRLPPLPPPAAEPLPDETLAVQQALERRPELKALRLKRAQQAVELELAENAMLPALNLFSEVSQDYGSGPESRAGSSFEAGVVFEVPFQRRKATGKSMQARAKMSAIDQELRWTEDEVRAEVQDALSALAAARAVLAVVSEELTVARELESLERDRFTLGDSTQFLVNLRELATADAALREARAVADLQKAQVAVETATGRLLDRAVP